jgi:cardiolipin synthase (CMP-forming)
VNRRDIPNTITVLRIFMVPPFVWLLLEDRYLEALVLFFIAGLSDGLDGFLAKRYDWTSRLGGLLDPLADKLLLVSAFIALGYLGLLPVYLVGLVLLRDLVIVSGAIAYHFRVARLDADPSWVSKVNTVLQIALVLLVIFNQVHALLGPFWMQMLESMVVLATVWSGLDYVWTWGQRARRHSGRME